MQVKVRIVSLNTWKNEGDYQGRLELTARQLRVLGPDIILLQECFRCEDTEDDTAAYLAEQLGYDCRYAPARSKLRAHLGKEPISESGLATLSRYPFGDCWIVQLPSSEAGGERVSLVCEVEVAHRWLGVACIHLSHIRSEASLRRQQIECVLKSMGQMRQRSPCLIGGDFNCPPDCAEIEQATAAHLDRYVNALPALGDGRPTSPGRLRESSSGAPGRQVDQLWVLDEGDEAAGYSVSVIDGGLCLDRSDGELGLRPSDHAGVWVDIELRARTFTDR